MLTESNKRLSDDKAWMQSTRDKLAQADKTLDEAFTKLKGSADQQTGKPSSEGASSKPAASSKDKPKG
ncbi:hypothetical protein TKWG_14110 [Advenella kashmirensis WT001]|uniref:Uncharacterized protein n=1 Tax=Advenella kashmirensis (strain DSM 17095 / LMG 22695 / WT001) TaxID=1036672 RepID=I3UD12_ADVKW|nr:hypothetical protein [Advenella kashmirensis]AFK62900.1 hypothetical protein TKWG_14110 [Advenella kashmirensis WT001]